MAILRLSRQAKEDLVGIQERIASYNSSAAIRVIETIEEALELLATHPEMGSLRDDLDPDLRLFSLRHPAHNYIIFFYPISDGIEVSQIVHGATDWLSMFQG